MTIRLAPALALVTTMSACTSNEGFTGSQQTTPSSSSFDNGYITVDTGITTIFEDGQQVGQLSSTSTEPFSGTGNVELIPASISECVDGIQTTNAGQFDIYQNGQLIGGISGISEGPC